MSEMYLSLIYLIVLIFFFDLSKGKQCPEEKKTHQNRCDSYFKCTILPSGSHVWVPMQCDQGLVYEPNLHLCVLPGDDWECILGEDDSDSSSSSVSKQDEKNVYGINGLELYPTPKRRKSTIKITNDRDKSDIDNLEFVNVKSVPVSSNIIISSNDIDIDSDENFESSGDDDDNTAAAAAVTNNNLLRMEMKESEGIELPFESKIDPKLTTQLQRLSQLIDGLKDNYQNKNSPNSDLRPDQLNAFLAHYNLKTDFDAFSPIDSDRQPQQQLQISQNGKIEPDILREILQKQQRLNNMKNSVNSNPSRPSSINIKVINSGNNSNKSGSIVRQNLANKIPTKNIGEYSSNSQIVVNRPGGSVLFNLPNSNSDFDNTKNSPRISEDTLKTVLELSKQMVANQNLRQVLPNNGFYQSGVHPFFYPIYPFYQRGASHQQLNSGDNDDDDNGDIKYEKISSSTYVGNYPQKHRPTTIIQNSVIPVHINKSPSESTGYDDSHNEQQNHKIQPIDSYGNRISNYIEYPPYSDNNHYSHRYENYQDKTSAKPSYHTPSPHLDNSNANNVVSIERYPTLPYEPPTPTTSAQYNQNSVPFILPQQINPASVKIRPNSYTTSDTSAEQMVQNEQHHTLEDSVNKVIVNNLLASNLDQHHNDESSAASSNHLVNLGGSFISFDIYKNQILPLSGGGMKNDISNIEVITCSAAVRQANSSDCTKYYVCSKKDRKVLSYSCPPYTAFNIQARICDAKTYAICNPQALYNRFTVAENRKIQMEALKALEEAKRIRDEAIQAQHLANLIRLQTQQVINNNTIIDDKNQNQMLHEPVVLMEDYMNGMQSLMTNNNSSTMMTPLSSSTTLRPLVLYGNKRKKYYCKEGEKIPDQTSVVNYYVCFKTKEGVMKGHRMTCSRGLMFCAKTALCTLPRKCNV